MVFGCASIEEKQVNYLCWQGAYESLQIATDHRPPREIGTYEVTVPTRQEKTPARVTPKQNTKYLKYLVLPDGERS